jgi:hypothetical protein
LASRPVVFANHHYMMLLKTSISDTDLYSFETGLSKTNELQGFLAPNLPHILSAIQRTFTARTPEPQIS